MVAPDPSTMRKRFIAVLAPGADDAPAVATLVACWHPDSTAPGASHEVSAGGGIVKGSVEVTKSVYWWQK